jgi:Terminase small subunit
VPGLVADCPLSGVNTLSGKPSEEMDPDIAAAIAQISQGPNGQVRVRLHDKHAALVSIGKHLGMFTDNVQIKAVYGIRDKPMSAEEWKKQYVKPG